MPDDPCATAPTNRQRTEWAENATTNPWKFACPDPAAHRPWWQRLLYRIGGWKW